MPGTAVPSALSPEMPARGSAAPAQTNTLEETFGAPIKQYPGQIQVTRAAGAAGVAA